MKKSKLYTEYAVNPVQFIKSTSSESVYILGLLWADGYIQNSSRRSTIALTTTSPDIECFLPIMMKTGSWRHYIRKKTQKNWKQSHLIQTNNRPLAKFLVKNGYSAKNNESADKILSHIPVNLQHYWFRGLLDGDGYIHSDDKGKHTIVISSSYEQDWNYLKQLCSMLGVEYSIHKTISNCGYKSSSFCVYGMYKTLKMCDYIYKNYPQDGIGLRRKYEKYLKLLSTEEKNRYKGVCWSKKLNKWRAYTSAAGGAKPKSLGVYLTKEKANEAVEHFYSTNPKCFLK